jgi:regulatory protein
LEVQKRNKKRVNVYLDGEYAFSLSLDEAARLRKGQTLTDAELERLREGAALTVALDAAARFLGYRPRSIHEVRQNLTQRGTPPAVIDSAIERLNAMGYLDDQQFAAFWVADRNAFKPVSPRALRYELRRKGVADADIDAALADLDAEDAAYRAAQSQVRRLRGSARRAFQEKLYVFLQRRGFSYQTARTIVRRLVEELDADSPDYFAGEDEGDRDDTMTGD